MDDHQPALSTGFAGNQRPASNRTFWLCLVALVVAAVILRVTLAVRFPTIERPDEVFQNLEPANRLWTGSGTITWEWREGIRSWLFPDILYGILQLASALHLPHRAAEPLIWAVLSLQATGVVVIGVVLGWRRLGLAGAILAGLVPAVWPDLVYFGPKTLTEVQGGNLLAIAAGLACFAPLRPGHPSCARLAAIGILLGFAFDLRFQLAPALLLVAAWAARDQVRRGWLPLLLGAALPLLWLGVLDWVTWGSPFQSIWKNLEINFFRNKADVYGVEPPWWYVTAIAKANGAATIPLLIFFCVGAVEAPLLAATAILVIAVHTLIAHKEISFIYAALPLAAVTVGLGTARFVIGLPGMLRVAVRPARVLAAAAAFWLLAAALTGYAEGRFIMIGQSAGLQSLWADLHGRTDLCGLGLYGRGGFNWPWSPGYAGLDRPVPISLVRSASELQAALPAFNYAIASTEDLPDLPGYQRLRCSWATCLLRRDGPCKPVPDAEISRALTRTNE